MFKPRPRPRLTRMSSSMSSSSFRKTNSNIYTFLAAGAILLLASVAFLQVRLGRAAPHRANDGPLTNNNPDQKHVTEQFRWKDASGKGKRSEPALEVRQRDEGSQMSGRREELDRSSHNQVRNLEQEGEKKFGLDTGDGREEEDGDGEGEDLRFDTEFDDREMDMDDDEMEDFEFGDVGEKLSEVKGFSKEGREFQGQVLDEMDKFVKGQVMEDSLKLKASDGKLPEKAVPNTESGNEGGDPAYREEQKSGINRLSELLNGGTLQGKINEIEGELAGSKQGIELQKARLSKTGSSPEQNKVTKARSIGGQELGEVVRQNRDRSRKENEGLSQTLEGSIRSHLEREVEKKKGSVFWDHALGVRKRTLEKVDAARSPGLMNSQPIILDTGIKRDADKETGEQEIAKVAMHQLRGFKEFVENLKERYNSDDEPLDEDVQRQLEEVVEIEDALMLDGGSSSSSITSLKKFGHQLKRPARVFDSVNPSNIPMLQDPDTLPGSYMTKSDKAILKAMRADEHDRVPLTSHRHLRGGLGQKSPLSSNSHIPLLSNGTVSNARSHKSIKKHSKEGSQQLEEDEEEIGELNAENLDLSVAEDSMRITGTEQLKSSEETKSNRGQLKEGSEKRTQDTEMHEEESGDDTDDSQQWGYYPPLGRDLKFSKFMAAFLKQESCAMRVFMAWTTAPWSYTTRHQRAMESLLHFHPKACVVVFTESIDFEFFESFVDDGYAIAVVRPNLEELLGGTPALDFAYVWPEWRNIDLFYIHYTELLRLAALYKYGGVYLDMDMILSKPLPTVHNAVGSTIGEGGAVVLNGAFMAFNETNPFLMACMEEFTATYNDKLLGWNGADLLNRVATNATREGRKSWLEEPALLRVQEPASFFPINLSSISRYFQASRNEEEREEQDNLLRRISNEAYATHLWNSFTVRLVPETGSLVETILNQHCMRCTDLL